MNIIIAYSRAANAQLVEKVKQHYPTLTVTTIATKEELNLNRVREINPDYLFFPHWSYYIPREIYEQFECVIFHMTDLPFGRGGSPLQNLIARGIYETKVSALKCVEVLDAGPVYLKKPLSLHGTAEEIYQRAGNIIVDMIIEMIEKQPTPREQEGEVVTFTRRKPADGDIARLEDLQQVYDYIRMLDADGYPRAFIETEELFITFEKALLKPGEVVANVRIKLKGEDEK